MTMMGLVGAVGAAPAFLRLDHGAREGRRARLRARTLAAVALAAVGLAARAGSLPRRPGQCVRTTISEIAQRLADDAGRPAPGSGSAIDFANGGSQVSYEEVGAVNNSRVGDPVRMCLVWIPHPCPRGDVRGRVYRTTNLRTGLSWKLPDSQHSCGGA